MKRLWKWYNHLSNRARTSIIVSASFVGLVSTIMSIVGISLYDWIKSIRLSLLSIAIAFIFLDLLIYWVIGLLFKDSVSMEIRKTPVSVCCGNIFETKGYRVIGCDTHFDTRVDDVVVSKGSLHGQLVLEHGEKKDIDKLVEKKAKELNLQRDVNGQFTFKPGTVIRYDSKKDGNTYLLLAMTEIRKEGDKYKSYTTMSKYEHMLMKMWKEIDGIYASNDIVLPLLGSGISRFEDGPKDKGALLRCMLCTLNGSGVTLNAKVKIVLFNDAKSISLYEYKDMFRSV